MSISKFVTIKGIKLHYLDHGTEGKPPLVCIHGLTGNAHNFDALAPHLSPHFHVRSLDVRGRGDSGWGPGIEYTPQNYVTDLAGFLDALAIERVTLIGTSMGGMISILFAGSYPNRVEKLVLNDIGPDVDPKGIARIGSYVGEAPTEFADLKEVGAYYREHYPPMRNLPEQQLLDQVRWSVKPAPNGKLTWKMDPQVRKPIRGGAAARPLDMWVPFTRIAAPVLVVRGADSDILARATIDRMKSVIRSVEAVEVAGVGHAPSLSEAESLAAIRKFLQIA
ncbi:MAG TPA: alpha/beta hydrolase [Candidatus Binataceae bacterium]|nr:alpha/beta hydrolase [Candidatus Binataceae bacterium]